MGTQLSQPNFEIFLSLNSLVHTLLFEFYTGTIVSKNYSCGEKHVLILCLLFLGIFPKVYSTFYISKHLTNI